MFVKTIFDKFKRFPARVVRLAYGHTMHCKFIPTAKPNLPIVYYYPEGADRKLLNVFLPDPPILISLCTPNEVFQNLTDLLQQLGPDKDKFLTEYAVYSAVAGNVCSPSTLPHIRELKVIKQDTIDILNSYSLSRKLLSELDKYDILVPIAMLDIIGHLFYQISAVVDRKVIIFTGVGNLGIRKDYEVNNSKIISPWDAPIRSSEADSTIFSLPNILFGITPVFKEVGNTSISGIEAYFEQFLDVTSKPIATLKSLSTANNFDKFIDNNLVPDSLLEKVSNGQPLSEEECENFSKFLDMVSSINTHKQVNLYDYYKHLHIGIFLKSLNLSPLFSPELPRGILKLSFITKRGKKQKTYMLTDDYIHTVCYNNEIYVIGDGRRDIWAFKVSGIDWKQIKREFLSMVYNYN